MDKIKIIKAISKNCDLKDERNARIRDSKFNKLTYYGGHIELINDKIDTVKLQGIAPPKNSCRVYTMNDLLNNGLEIYDSNIDEIIAEYECSLHLYKGANVNKLVCRYQRSSAAIKGEAVVSFLGVADGGSTSVKHGQVDQAHVGREGKLYVSERAVISHCEVVPNGVLRVGYRYSRAQSVPVIHRLKACCDSTILFKGDCCIGEFQVCQGAKIQRQFNATICIGRLIENNHPVSDVNSWIHKHSVDFIS